MNHHLRMSAAHYTPVDDALIITGEVAPVAGTPLDFTGEGRSIGGDMARFNAAGPGGYDHNFVVDGWVASALVGGGEAGEEMKEGTSDDSPAELRHAATLTDPDSGRSMTITTNAPGIQAFTCSNIDAGNAAIWTGKGGTVYAKHGAVCLETQNWPDAINNLGAGFPDPRLRVGERYRHVVVHAFRW